MEMDESGPNFERRAHGGIQKDPGVVDVIEPGIESDLSEIPALALLAELPGCHVRTVVVSVVAAY